MLNWRLSGKQRVRIVQPGVGLIQCPERVGRQCTQVLAVPHLLKTLSKLSLRRRIRKAKLAVAQQQPVAMLRRPAAVVIIERQPIKRPPTRDVSRYLDASRQ